MTPASLKEYARLVDAAEAAPPAAATIAALEHAIASDTWVSPSDREAAQVLVMRLAYVRATLPAPRADANGMRVEREGDEARLVEPPSPCALPC